MIQSSPNNLSRITSESVSGSSQHSPPLRGVLSSGVLSNATAAEGAKNNRQVSPAQQRPKTTAFTGELEEIRRIKTAWKESSATDESKKLQDLIEERKRNARLTKKKEEAWIMKRSKDCRAFYKEQYVVEKEQEKRETKELNIALIKCRREHRERREAEEEKNAMERYEKYKDLRRLVKSTGEKTKKQHRRDRIQHYADYDAVKAMYPQRSHERKLMQKEEIYRSTQDGWKIRDKLQEDRQANGLVMNDWALAVEEDKEKKRESLMEIRERRLLASSNEARAAMSIKKKVQHDMHQSRQRQDITDSERPTRVAIIRAERHQRWELTQLFKTVMSDAYLNNVARQREETSRNYRSTLTPVPDSSDLLRASERSAIRARDHENREYHGQLRLEQKQVKAHDFRKTRLEKVKAHMTEEFNKANATRMASLNRRRGERMMTETDAYQVNDGDVALYSTPSIDDHLPAHLTSLVIDIVRGKTTKDDVDLYQL